MSCAACSARVEKAAGGVEGVTSCAVNLLTNTLAVEGNAADAAIIEAVEKAGYGAAVKREKTISPVPSSAEDDVLTDKETPRLKKRLIASVCFLLILMYLSMGHTMWGLPLPAALEDNPLALALLEMVLAAIILVINQKFFISGFFGLIRRAPNMDTLVALGSGAAYVYSVCGLFAMTAAAVNGDAASLSAHAHDLYFETAAMIVTLITVGKMLEARAKGRTTDALKGLMRLAPTTAVIEENGREKTVPVETLKKGDIFVVRPGEHIPADGVIIEGSGAVDESVLTGESIPVDKSVGDGVTAATTNKDGFLRCEALRVGEDTTLSQIIRMVTDASATKAPIAKIADRVAGVFVPVVMIIATVTFIVWLLLSSPVAAALTRAVAVLVISCPCALGLATPVAIMVGSGRGAKEGILFKNAAALEMAGKTEIVVLDKTGTVTVGEPRVTDILPADGFSEEDLLALGLTLERRSEHPLALAVVAEAERRGVVPGTLRDFTALPGNGLKGREGENSLVGGSVRFVGELVAIDERIAAAAEELAAAGKTPLLFAENDILYGIIAVADTVKADSRDAVRALKEMGLGVVMLTGDNEITAEAIAAEVGIGETVAGVLPDGKEKVVRELAAKGRVAMVGDGVNDAPALAAADIGIAIGAGADVAVDAADIVLMNNGLTDAVNAIALSRATLKNIRQNLFWAFFYNIITIPLAAGVFIFLLGWQLNPMVGAAAMALSSFCVVSNALRLNLFKTKKIVSPAVSRQAEKAEEPEESEELLYDNLEEENKMTEKIITIEGMACGHCSARVKSALEAIDGVSAEVSHETKKAVVKLAKDVADDALKKAVEDQGYEVIAID